jgi:hypothetical protein
MSDVLVQHDEKRHRFWVDVDGLEAFLDYVPLGDDKLDYVRTFVPTELRGKGLADRIVKVALEWADARGKEVIPSCWYVAKVLERRSGA